MKNILADHCSVFLLPFSLPPSPLPCFLLAFGLLFYSFWAEIWDIRNNARLMKDQESSKENGIRNSRKEGNRRNDMGNLKIRPADSQANRHLGDAPGMPRLWQFVCLFAVYNDATLLISSHSYFLFGSSISPPLSLNSQAHFREKRRQRSESKSMEMFICSTLYVSL